MLEIRYIISTTVLTGWCASETQFGNLDRDRDTESITVISAPIPDKEPGAWLFDEQTQALIPNPDYIPPAEDYKTTPDFLRACELLSQSPPAITMPDIWELLRIIGRRLGFRFEE